MLEYLHNIWIVLWAVRWLVLFVSALSLGALICCSILEPHEWDVALDRREDSVPSTKRMW